MKKISVLLLIAFVFLNCSKNETPRGETLKGEWSLIKFSCGTCDTSEFEAGQKTWRFDLSENKIFVEDNSSSNPVILVPGSYNIAPSLDPEILNLAPSFDTTDKTFMRIDSDFHTDIWFYYFENEKLFLVASGSELPTLEFVR